MKAKSATPGAGKTQSILARLLASGDSRLTPELARYILSLGFDQDDQTRMQDLAQRNQEGALSPSKREDLFGYVEAGHLLALLQSNARKVLRRKKVS